MADRRGAILMTILASNAGDTTAPTLTIGLSDTALKTGDTSTITFTFSEAPTNFTVADVTAPNGSLSSFTVTGNPLVYTATFTPDASVSDATNVITVGTNWTDAAGNPPAGNTTSENYTVDTTAPTVAITSTETSPSAKNPIPLTFTLSEASTNFAIGDITVGAGGTLGNFAGSGASYTADLTVTTAGATITVDVAQGTFTDAAGNGNTAATQFSITSGITFLDDFTTSDAAPITTPRTCEPGPGTLTVVDASNVMGIAGAKVVVSGTPAAATYFKSALLAHTAGLLTSAKLGWTAGRPYVGYFPENPTNANGDHLQILLDTRVDMRVNNNGLGTVYAQLPAKMHVIKRQTAGHFFICDTKLVWVSTIGTAAVYSGLGVQPGVAADCTFDGYRVVQMGAPWTTNTGIATNATASPGVNATTTQLANAIVEMTWTAVTGETWNLMVRRTDDDNCWIVRCDQANSKIYLYQKQTGSETERGATGGVAQTWTNGTAYRVLVTMDGNTIKVYVETAASSNPAVLITYASATFNSSATGVKTDKAGTNLIAWPRDLAGAALTELNRCLNP